jgi:DnaJ-class molecular chaperone
MRDPYTVLGVQRKATPQDVKSAFRGLAKQYHPDIAGDGEMIAATFQEINAAYDILGDSSKRDQFDRGEIDARGLPIMRRQNSRAAKTREARARAANVRKKGSRSKARGDRSERPGSDRGSSTGQSAADAWAAKARSGSGRSRPKKNQGEDFKTYSWGRQAAGNEPDPNAKNNSKKPAEEPARRSRADEVFSDLFAGLKSKAQAAQNAKPDPATDKATPPDTEPGARPGTEPEPSAKAPQEPASDPAPEPKTDEAPGAAASRPQTSAREPAQDSYYNLSISFDEAARGTSRRVKLPNGKRLDVKIPAGVSSGQQIWLKGQGKSDAAHSGDAILEINVEPHRYFTCEGDDIYLVLPVTIDEAVLGAKVMVPTLDGPVAMTVPAGANSDTTLRLKGRGLPREVAGDQQLYGDQYVSLKIVLPAANDKDFKDAVEKWSAGNAYDVRSDFMF